MRLTPASRASGLAFITAGVVLATQVLVHRLVSAKLLNNYAFLVISLTMLGFAISGVFLTRWLETILSALDEALSASAALFVLTLLGSARLFCGSTAGAAFGLDRLAFVAAFLRWLPLALLFALPFAFAGLMLGALLAAPQFSARRIYFFDLVGSALGAGIVVTLIGRFGVEISALMGCVALLGGTLVLAPPKRPLARSLAVLASLTLATAFALPRAVFDLYFPDGSTLAPTRQPGSGMVLEHTAWDAVARIEVARIPPPSPEGSAYPCFLGTNRAFHQRFRRMLTQNNYAFTYAFDYDGTRDSLRGTEETIYAAAYEATSVSRPRVAVIGVGGGFDILTALYYDARAVTGIEVNNATLGILENSYRDYFRAWVQDPRVHLIAGEGRHVLGASPNQYDVIQLSGVDSYAGTAAAAYVFSENYLYTAQAFDLYLSRLSPDGILNMMRLELDPPREMLRGLATAVGALRRAGVARPAEHIVMLTATNRHFTALLIKRTPFTPEEGRRIDAWAASSPYFAVSASPFRTVPPSNLYEAFLALGTPAREAAFVRLYPFDVTPTDDDRPFFFKYSYWWHLFSDLPAIRASVPVMEYSVLMLVSVLGLAALACVLLPLRVLAARGRRMESSLSLRWVVYFAGAGLGYLAVEMALLQEFGLFLGHPNYSLSVVLAALLLSSGLGSLFSARVVRALGGVRFVSYALAAVVFAEYGVLLPRLPLASLSFPIRVAVVFALVAPLGILLGVFVPSALERLKVTAPEFVPWAWGVNGIFSVIAPILAVAFSMTWGISALLLSSIPVYLIVGWSFPGTP